MTEVESWKEKAPEHLEQFRSHSLAVLQSLYRTEEFQRLARVVANCNDHTDSYEVSRFIKIQFNQELSKWIK